MGSKIAAVDAPKVGSVTYPEDGVSADVSTKLTGRGAAGRWLPGQSGNPKGRPTKAEELAILDAIKMTFSPDEMTSYLRRAMTIAEENESARGMVAVMEFVWDRVIGPPAKRVMIEQGGLSSVLEELGE